MKLNRERRTCMFKGKNMLMILLVLSFTVASLIVVFLLSRRSRLGEQLTTKAGDIEITMSWWGNDGRHMYTMEGVDLFQQKNNLKVNYRYGVWNGYEKRNKVWMESHNEADVMQINFAWLKEYSPDGRGFYDLRELSQYIDLSNFTEEELSYGEINGVLNALPIAMNTHTFYYNQDLLDKYGCSVPETWEDIEELGGKAEKDGRYALGITKKQLFLLMIAYYEQTSGKVFFNEDGTLAIDEAGMTEVLKYYRMMIDKHIICPVSEFDRQKYMSGEVVGVMCWISDTRIYCDQMQDTGVNVSRKLWLKADGALSSGWYVKPATMWAISADTQHPAEAARLLNYLLNDPDMAALQKTEKGVPVSDAAVEALTGAGLTETNEYKATQEMNEHQQELHIMIPVMENEAVLDIFKSGADEYLYDKQSVEAAAKAICSGIRELAVTE